MNAPLELPTDVLDGPRPVQAKVDAQVRTTIDQLEQVADRGAYREAAAQAADLLSAGVYDIRLATVYLAGLFAERGLEHLPIILDITARLLRDEARSPAHVRPRPRVLDNALQWLIQGLTTRIYFHAKRRDEVWAAWSDAEGELPQRIADALDELLRAAREVVDEPSCEGAIAKARRWAIQDLARSLELRRAKEQADLEADRHAAEAEVEAADESGPSGGASDSGPQLDLAEDDLAEDDLAADLAAGNPDPTPVDEHAPQGQAPGWGWGDADLPTAGPISGPGAWNETDAAHLKPGVAAVEESTALTSLREKLAAFQQLSARGDLARAAIIARDVQQLIEDFDPVVYFPALFADYFRAMSRNLEALRPHLEQGDTSMWNVLSRFYQADLDGFVND